MSKLFILIGRSGCGKGTQAQLLQKFLAEQNSAIPILYIETGKNFRAFAETSQTRTAQLVKETIGHGGLLPDFLAVWNWSRILIDKYTGEETIIFDGICRTKLEAEMINTAAQFYGWEKPTIIHIAVSNGWSRERLLARGRSDDSEEFIKRRLEWFDKDVVPALEYFKANPTFHYIEVLGERPIEAIHQEIVSLI